MTMEIEFLALDRDLICGVVKPINRIPSLLYNWIANGNTYINNKCKSVPIPFHYQKPQTLTTYPNYVF